MRKNAIPGTSPRLWGDSTPACMPRRSFRYIPTLVGRLRRSSICVCNSPVHPHACGEIVRKVAVNALKDGTSPRLWGDCKRERPPEATLRYIPTLVGRFCYHNKIIKKFLVHPHACGEILSMRNCLRCLTGTSPRLWGD